MPIPKRRLRPARLVLPLLALAACEGGGEGAGGGEGGFATRDSAGVRIAESGAPAWGEGQGWRLSPGPVLRVGEVEGEGAYLLSWVAGAARLADGTLVVADGPDGELRYYGPDGRHLRTVGGRGGGPGEFGGVSALLRARGDTVAAWDVSSNRLSYFAPDGGFARAVTLPPGDLIPGVTGIFADGSLLVVPPGSRFFDFDSDGGEGPRRDTATYLRWVREGAPPDTLVRLPGRQSVLVRGRANRRTAMRLPVPFGLATYAAAGDSLLYVGDNARYEVAAYGLDGRLRALVRRAHRPEPLTDEEVSAYRREQLDRAGPDFRPLLEQGLATVPFPRTKPAFQALMRDREGNLWLQEHAAPGSGTVRWAVFDPAGRWLGHVALPGELRVLEIGADYVVGVASDELDVQQVQVYRLEKGPAPGGGG